MLEADPLAIAGTSWQVNGHAVLSIQLERLSK
jgi:hypothetical protein